MARRIALVLEYDGTDYAGFQFQAGAPTIQGAVEEAVEGLTSDRTRLHGAGRTDAGVHARGQVAAFDTESALPVERVREGLNHHLPAAIVVQEAYDVEEGFDPRRQAVARTYRYTFLESRVRSPLRGRFVHTIGRTLDVAAMGEAGALLAGTRDFAPFCGQRPQGGATVRNVSHATVSRQGGDEVWLEVEANAFLHQQMRRIAGAVQEVGLGRMTIAAFAALVESGVHGAARLVLPARGLCLRKVEYQGFPPLEAGAKTGIGEVAVN